MNVPLLSYARIVRRLLRSVEIAGGAIALGAMILLAIRAALRLELRWDTFQYHLPFAAMRAGMHIPYELPPEQQAWYQGFPPLPEFLEGILWRATGSVNATGVVNYLGFVLFLFFAGRQLHVRLWIVVLLGLTAPLVLIHTACSYIDLFSNCLLAIGVTAFICMMLFDRWRDRHLLLWALAGLAGAAWSKYTMLPIVLLVFTGFVGTYAWRWSDKKFRRPLLYVAIALFMALMPYAKNTIVYHNPLWPVSIPFFKDRVPYITDAGLVRDTQTPPPLRGRSRTYVFFHSLFEIDHPTSYPNRERWIIDQGNAWIAFRSGGFWAVGVITAALSAVLLGFLSRPRNGLVVAGAIATLWLATSVLPQSNDLRYFQFLPLTVAATIGMLVPRARINFPATTLAICCIVLCQFVWITKVNRSYYRVERVGYAQAAEFWDAAKYWKTLEPGKTYCAVNFAPAAFLMTGPTMHEFHMIDRATADLCPPGVLVLRKGK